MVRASHADEVRKFARDRYVVPGRAAGKRSVEINVGAVHKAMGYRQRVPLVATALTAKKFRDENKLKLIRLDGPGQSTTTTYLFELE